MIFFKQGTTKSRKASVEISICNHPTLVTRSDENMVATFLDLIKNRPGPSNIAEKKNKLTCLTFRCLIALRNKTIAHSFLLSFVNANERLCQEQ